MKYSALVLLLALSSTSQAAVNLKSPGTDGSVTFLAVGKPSMLKIHGNAPGPVADFTLAEAKLSGSAKFDLAKLDTGIELRDKHMKEKYLNVGTTPNATLTLKDVATDKGFESNLTNSSELPFEGTLNLHGKDQPVKGTYTAKAGKIEAKFPIKLTDYAIEIPTYLGATVAENVSVEVTFPLKKE